MDACIVMARGVAEIQLCGALLTDITAISVFCKLPVQEENKPEMSQYEVLLIRQTCMF